MTTSPPTSNEPCAFEAGLDFARAMDLRDPLRGQRERFHIPRTPTGADTIYLCGNSLGLQPKTTRALVEQELDDWAALGVEAHFKESSPWYSYHEQFREAGARLVGALPGEVVMMNSLTTNLHLMMVSFYRPIAERFKILMESPAFPSDLYAINTHVRSRGLDPKDAVITVGPRSGEHTVREDDIAQALSEHGDQIALVLIGGVSFITGQVFDMERITQLAHAQGCIVGFDLAHAAGNMPLQLHDWSVDFACWCSYKYLNSGPGAVAGCFVNQRHASNTTLVRYGGWWGNDPDTRFRMQLIDDFHAKADADGWQLSNPPILAMAPLRASIDIFDEVGMDALRAKSITLTGYLRWIIEQNSQKAFEIITPRDPRAQGCQLSIVVHDEPCKRFDHLQLEGVICDFRQPNVIRVAPTPLYNTFEDVYRFAQLLTGATS